MPTVRAKFGVERVERNTGNVTLRAIGEETLAGVLNMSITNPEALARFTSGQEYDVDFALVEAEATEAPEATEATEAAEEAEATEAAEEAEATDEADEPDEPTTD